MKKVAFMTLTLPHTPAPLLKVTEVAAGTKKLPVTDTNVPDTPSGGKIETTTGTGTVMKEKVFVPLTVGEDETKSLVTTTTAVDEATEGTMQLMRKTTGFPKTMDKDEQEAVVAAKVTTGLTKTVGSEKK